MTSIQKMIAEIMAEAEKPDFKIALKGSDVKYPAITPNQLASSGGLSETISVDSQKVIFSKAGWNIFDVFFFEKFGSKMIYGRRIFNRKNSETFKSNKCTENIAVFIPPVKDWTKLPKPLAIIRKGTLSAENKFI